MPFQKGKPLPRDVVERRAKTQTKWDWLPQDEIVDRLLNSSATVRGIATEYGCSKSTIDKIFRRHTTLSQRLKVKYEKQSRSLREHKFDRIRRPVDPQVIKARTAVNNAVRDGRLIRPEVCSSCDKKRRIQAHHHKGYEDKHALDVEWLCQKCHRATH